jgi:hypothetical protein
MPSLGTFSEQTSGQFRGQLWDPTLDTPAAVPGATITALYISLIRLADLSIVNGRNKQLAWSNGAAVVGVSGVDIDADGWLTINFGAADGALAGAQAELQRIVLQITWPGGALAGQWDRKVSDVTNVP